MNAFFPLAQSEVPSAKQLALWTIATLVAVAIIWKTGAYRPASVIGPERRGRMHIRPLAILMIAAFMLSLVVAQGFLMFQQVKQQNAGLGAFDLASLTPSDWAFLSVVPGLAGIILLLFGHLGGKTGAIQELGLAPSQFVPGVLIGVLGVIVVLPIMTWWLLLLEWFYQSIRLQHPNEHELLHELSQASGFGTKAAIVVGATIVAPVFEELIFRGHLQTLLVRLLTHVDQRGLLLDSGIEPIVVEPASRDRAVWPYWCAIVLSSLLFASIHDHWMAPAIFVLSLCLGYLYQRTGNLWVTIVLHSLFNVFNTITFLALSSGH